MLSSYFNPQPRYNLSSDVEVLKVLAFSMADYVFALPISLIYKVIKCPPIAISKDSNLGIADFEGRTVVVVDLDRQLSTPNSTDKTRQKRFLILSQTRQGELCGIPIDRPPTLLELPQKDIQPLPVSARQIKSLSIATHVVTLSKSDKSPNSLNFFRGQDEVKIFLIGI